MSDDTTPANTIETALLAGAAMSAARTVGQTSYVVVPEGYRLVDLERLLSAPTRKRGSVNALSAAGFVAYFQKHHSEEAPATIYADRKRHAFTAIFDDDSDSGAGWRQHVLTYTCPKSVEWGTWWAADGTKRSQEDFAKFIEDNLPDVIDPDAATMLEISRTLEAKKSVEFASAIRLANGENELKFTETVEGTAAKGNLRIPDVFKIGIPVFQGGAPYAVLCRLRYRIPTQQAKGLMMWFELDRPHKVVDAAFALLYDKIKTDTGVEPIEAEVPVARPGYEDA